MPPTTSTSTSTSSSSRRARAFEHVDGHFATHVKVPIARVDARDGVDARGVMDALRRMTVEVPQLEACGLPDDDDDDDASGRSRGVDAVCTRAELHVSLSRVFPIAYEEAEAMRAALKIGLLECEATTATFNAARVFLNDDETRVFVAIGFREGASDEENVGKADLVRMIDRVNAVCASMGLPEYYDDPEPHASLAWTAPASDDTVAILRRLAREVDVSWTIDIRRIVLDVSGLPDKTVWAREPALPPPAL